MVDVVAVVATLVVAAVAATAAREVTVVVEDTSKVVEEVMVDRVATVVVVDTSRVDMVVDTEHCHTAALAPSACWVSRSFALLDCLPFTLGPAISCLLTPACMYSTLGVYK